jgi:hypothetical protein
MRLFAPIAAMVAATLVLAGCQTFAPAYDTTLDTQMTTAFQGVAKLSAEIELGSYANASTYSGATDEYTTIISSLTVAALRADTLPVQAKAPAEKARTLLTGLIKGCQTQVTTVAAIHKATGLAPGAGIGAPMLTSCDQAARAAQALKP